MADRPWKRFERKTAATFNTTRKLMKGTSEKSDIGGDDPAFPLVLDCKHRKKEGWQICKWFSEIEQAAVEQRKWAVLVAQEPQKIRSYAFTRWTPTMVLITHKCKDVLSADDFYVKEVTGKNIRVAFTWDRHVKKMAEMKNKGTLPKDVIPMLHLNYTGYNIEMAVMRPEDLARIFRIGGILKNGDKTRNQSGH